MMAVATSIGPDQGAVLTRAGERRAGWTRGLFTNPVTERARDYITGRFG